MRTGEDELSRLHREATRAATERAGCPEPELLVAAALDELSPSGGTALAGHLAECSTCSEELLRLYLAGSEAAGRAAVSDLRPAAELRAARWRAVAGWSGLAAAGLLAWNVVGWRSRAQVAGEPSLNVPILDLDPAAATRGGSVPAIRHSELPAGGRVVTLVLNLAEPPRADRYALELLDGSGSLLWRGEGAVPTAWATVTVALPTRLLGPGPRTLRLLAGGAGAERLVEEYRLELTASSGD
jgi:hypothetical protein